jgi:tyrocidine synthetase-3
MVGYKVSPQQSQILSYGKYADRFEEITVTINGRIDKDRLFSSIRDVTERHSIFSTTYQEAEKLSVQVINDNALIDFSDLAAKSFGPLIDIKSGPLVRVISYVQEAESIKLEMVVASICLDEWSVIELVNQIGRTYNEDLNGTGQHEILQYIQFSEWQNQMMEDGDNVFHRIYWRDLNLPAPLRLPFDTADDKMLFTDSHMLVETQLSRFPDPSSVEKTLRTSWYLLIWKLSQGADIVLHDLHPLRDFEELHSSVGPFSTCLPVSIPILASQSFREVLTLLESVVANNEQHKYAYRPDVHYPYGFSFLSFLSSPVSAIACTLSSPHNLMLSCLKTTDTLVTKIKYSSHAFDHDHIQFIADAFITIVNQVIENPEISVGEIALYDQSRELEFIHSINSTMDCSVKKNVFQVFQEQVETYPERLAVVSPHRQFTYSALAAKVDGLAEALRDLNVRPGDLVGILCGQDENIPIAFLASLKLGAAFLPIDPANPDSRIEYIINDSQVKIVVTTTEFRQKVDGIGHVICIDTVDVTDKENGYAHNSQQHDVAYTIYTSGSTGKPKGVQISNGALLNYVSWFRNTYAISPDDKGVLLSSYAFDLGYTVIWGTLLSGSCLHILPLESVKKPDAVVDYINAQGITLLKLTPSLFYGLVHAINAASLRKGSLRLILLGGEKINSEDIALVDRIKTGITFVNHYGPTETTIGTIAKTIDTLRLDLYSREPVIGKGITNNRVFIIDGNNRVMPPYVLGEICISGAGVSNGYINRPDLTREKFVSDPYLSGQLMYKTGDIGYWTLNGEVLLKGRIDDQVKVRGYRVELNEVNTVISRFDEITQVVVLAMPSQEGSNELYAYVVPGADFLYESFRNYLGEVLPDYMIPTYIFMVDAIPLNENGKVDKQALIKTQTRDLKELTEYVPPRTALEKSLALLFEEVLKKNRIGLKDDFFDLGGNSLKAIQLVSRIYKTLNYKVDLKVIFTATTIQKLTALISPSTEGYSEIQAVAKQFFYPVSSGQRRLWILSQQEDLEGIYNVPSFYRIHGNLEIEMLRMSFDTLVARHESLRTTFCQVGESVMQKIDSFENTGFSVKYVDLSQSFEKDKTTRELAERHALEVFNLTTGPLIKVMLIRQAIDSHVLCLNVHHIVSDEWSRSVLIRDVLSLYKTNVAGEPGELSPLRIHYKDFANWELEELSGNHIAGHREYWLQHLKGEIPVLNLPSDFIRPAIRSYSGDNVAVEIAGELTEQLRHVSREMGLSLFMILASALKVLFYKYTGQKDMIIGMPVTGRKNKELEDQIGFYVNTLAIRSKINDDDTFVDFLLREKENTLQAYAHDVYPFDRLLEDIKPDRDLSRSPLFDVLMLFRSASLFSAEHHTVTGLEFDSYELDIPHSKFDLTFNFNEGTDGLNLSVEFCTDLYRKSTVQRMLSHYQQLLPRLLSSMKSELSSIHYISDDERDELLNKFNTPGRDYPVTDCVIDLFEEQCRKNGDLTAVVCGKDKLTYAELNEEADRLCRYLRHTSNVGADDLVGIMMDRSVNQVIGLLAILKAGAAYVPIDKKYPESTVDRILQRGDVKTVLVDEDINMSFFVEKGYKYVVCAHYKTISSTDSDDNIHRTNNSASLAYIIHTSGSTGIPKGVMIENRSVVRLVKNTNFYNFKTGDKLLQTGSISFDASTFEVWGPLLNGGEVHLISTDDLLNEQYLKDYINGWMIDVMWFTSSWFNQLVDSDITIFQNLQTILVGGEKLSKAHIHKLKSTYPEVTIINGYGPTENTTFSTFYIIDGSEVDDIPIGRPIANSEAYILDEHNNLVGKGVYGEICVGGTGLARGYFHDESLTHLKFIAHPWNSGNFIYKTGDIGRWLEDGNIQYKGRKDRQVKLRGYRIEVGEIENALLNHSLIRNAFVLPKSYSGLDNLLVAYLVAHSEVDTYDLRRYLKDYLAEYMIPSHFVFLDKFPLTPNGKIDERALPEPKINQVVSRMGIAPRTRLEREIAAVWEKVLDRQDISIDENFFDLGGHSLKASQLITKLYRDLNYKIELRDVFANPTIQELSQIITSSGQRSFKAIERVPVGDHYNLSHAQKRLWIVDQLQSDRAIYNINNSYRVSGTLDTDALNNALATLIDRHEILRTYFTVVEGEVRQNICSNAVFAMQYDSVIDDVEKQLRIEEILKEEESKAFNLTEFPLIRARLIHTASDEHIFILTLHHIIADGWSMDILFSELTGLYESFIKRTNYSSMPLSIQYKDYAQWHNDLLNGPQGIKERAYWLNKFSGHIPTLDLPTDYDRPKVRTFNGDNVQVDIDKNIADGLLQITKDNNYSLFIALVAAVKAVFFRYSGQEDITLGTVVAGRDHVDLEDQLGYYVNNLPLRTRFNGDYTLKQLINRVAETVLEAFDHQLYPFDLLVDDLAIPVVSGQRSPLFDIFVTYQNFGGIRRDIQNLVIEKITKRTSKCKYDMVITFVDRDEGLMANIEYNTDIYNEVTIRQLAKNILLILQHMVYSSDDKLYTLPMDVGVADFNQKSVSESFNFDFNL